MDKKAFYTAAETLGIGNTPLIPYEEDFDADIYVKNEAMNASGSVKDRPALAMILQAEEDGALHSGDTIVEATSGNMGIALAYIGLKRGYRVLLTMPETMTVERRQLLQGLGAQLVLTEGALGMKGAIEQAEILGQRDGHLLIRQFANRANAAAHYLSTADEIAHDLDRVDVFVAGVGTGGTITGAGKYLKERIPDFKVIAVEPASSAVLSGGKAGAHGLQGLGAGFVPQVLDTAALRVRFGEVIPLSAHSGAGVDALCRAVEELFAGGETPRGELLTNARQAESAQRALDAVRRAEQALRSGLSPDAVLTDAEEALEALAEFSGKRVRDDLVATIFSRFCVGKCPVNDP